MTKNALAIGKPPYRVGRARLQNGLKLVTVETPHLHSATLRLYVRAGSRYETPGRTAFALSGAHAVSRLVALPVVFALNLAIEALGGTLYAETGRDYSLYQISLHPGSFCAGWRSSASSSAARVHDIDVERHIVLEEMHEDLDEHGRKVNIDDLARKEVWPDHPLGFASPARYERAPLLDADVRRTSALLRRRNMVLTCRPVRMRTVDRRPASPSPRAAGERREVTGRRDPRGRAALSCRANESAQTQVHILFHALPETDPDFLAMRALVRMLDDGMSTRLHCRICDQRASPIRCRVAALVRRRGALEIDAACVHAKLPALVGEALGCWPLRDELVARRARQGEASLRRRYRGQLRRSRRHGRLVGRHRALHAGRPAGKRARALAGSPRAHPGGRAPGDPTGAALGDVGGRAQPEAFAAGREDCPRVSLGWAAPEQTETARCSGSGRRLRPRCPS